MWLKEGIDRLSLKKQTPFSFLSYTKTLKFKENKRINDTCIASAIVSTSNCKVLCFCHEMALQAIHLHHHWQHFWSNTKSCEKMKFLLIRGFLLPSHRLSSEENTSFIWVKYPLVIEYLFVQKTKAKKIYLQTVEYKIISFPNKYAISLYLWKLIPFYVY